MFDSEDERALRRLFAAPDAHPPNRTSELEGRLLAAFAARYPTKEKMRMKSLVVRRTLLVSAAAGVLGVVACTAPVDLDVDMGRHVAISYDSGTPGSPEPREIADFLRSAVKSEEAASPGQREVMLQVRKEGTSLTVDATLWGTNLPKEPFAPRLLKAFPALEGARIAEEPLQSKVRGTLARKLGHDVLDLAVVDTADAETARKQIMAQLAARGVEGKVDVKVEGEGNERKVRIEVERREGSDPGVSEAAEK